MVRLFKYLLFALAFAIASLSAEFVYAQTTGATATPSPTSTATGASPLPTRGSGITASVAMTTPVVPVITDTTTLSATQEPLLVPTPSPISTTTGTITAPAPLTQAVLTPEESAPLEGTIIANRSQTVVRFFLEGATYELAEDRSQGINLPRATTVLNLFNCPGTLPDDTAGCFWDPYLIQQDGFYEIYEAPGSAAQVKLMLREAGTPPTGQVWVQNRTGQTESLVFKDEVYEIPPTTVLEFPVATGVPAILYVRSCQTIDNQSACEWAPKTLDAGVYYAMVEVDTPGSQAGTTQTTIDLRPVVGEGEETGTTEVASAAGILCSVVVPALNVRSGPGLQYDIIGKVRTDGEAVTVNVTGRSADNQWLTVEPSVAEDGWINNSPSFINCSGDLVSLPVMEAPPPPTPLPAVAESPVITTDGSRAGQPEGVPPADAPLETATPAAPAAATVPAGLAVLVVNNGFQHEMRFTIDQVFRPQDGPSEYDLAPCASISIVVYPGDVAFTASSPWSGLSSNATVHIDADQSLPLWLRFEPDTDGSWVFRWN